MGDVTIDLCTVIGFKTFREPQNFMRERENIQSVEPVTRYFKLTIDFLKQCGDYQIWVVLIAKLPARNP